jgi:hypothetical protein
MPRAQLSTVPICTFLAGFLTSLGLLHAGVTEMGLRYGAATIAAYGAFLLLIGAWVRYYRAHPREVVLLKRIRGHSKHGQPDEHRGRFDMLDLVEAFIDEGLPGVLMLLLASALVYLAVVAAGLIPGWIAELILDAAVGAALYRRIRQIDRREWLPSTFRKTVVPFLIAVFVFVSAGEALQEFAPEASSIAGVVRHATLPR